MIQFKVLVTKAVLKLNLANTVGKKMLCRGNATCQGVKPTPSAPGSVQFRVVHVLYLFTQSFFSKTGRNFPDFVLQTSLGTFSFFLSTYFKNKTNHPILSNNHPSATANKQCTATKWGGGLLQNQREHH